MKYHEFIASKHIRADSCGFYVPKSEMNPALFDWQKDVIAWACQKGRAALFQDCGLGKTPQQLEWARLVHEKTNGPILIVAPLAVNKQTIKEGIKFNIKVNSARDQSEVKPGLNVTNYEMVDHFDPAMFSGVVLDESSILKSFMGTTKRRLIQMFQSVPYRLCCTATPAPNDSTELGNHSEFLGYFSRAEMLSRWFTNDGFNSSAYRLKGHAQHDFWRWVASWSVAIQTPADLGYTQNGYKLPPLETVEHVVNCDDSALDRGMLVDVSGISATNIHQELRRTAHARADQTANIVNQSDEQFVVWCHTDYEADELNKRIPDAIEVRGSMPIHVKAERLESFTGGDARVIITKPRIAGWGLNWQHCRNIVTVGPSYSFEMRYQAVRRCWRYGQSRKVFDHIVMSARESSIFRVAQAKEKNHMSMANAIKKVGHELSQTKKRELAEYNVNKNIIIPKWLQSEG